MHHQMLKIGTLILKARNEPVIGTSQLPKVKNVMPKALGPSFHPILTPKYFWAPVLLVFNVTAQS